MLWDTLSPLDQPTPDQAPLLALPLSQDVPATLSPIQAPAGEETGHQALYRKWRSRSFEDVVGQAHVTRTLRNAVATNTVGHAYLFTGTRGTGKTSTARVLARAVNCLNPRDGNPCNECSICRGMEERRSMDLVEIDAASNNSVDDVRDLREKVGYAPSEARRKVYVIDEVHMLSTSAFNALLKTLEEPPRHVLFVLATTEVHRVPATVASRCQRFDFRPITPADTAARLAYVAGQEGITADPAALETLARYATGSLRDALGLLDQVRAFSGPTIGVAEVQEALGIADPQTLRDLAGYLLAGDLAGALQLVDELGARGADLRQFGRQMVGYWRDLLVARARNTWPPDLGETLPSPAAIAGVIKAFLQADAGAKRSTAAQLHVELALLDAVASLSSNGATIAASAPVGETAGRAPVSSGVASRPQGVPAAAGRSAQPSAGMTPAQRERPARRAPDVEPSDAGAPPHDSRQEHTAPPAAPSPPLAHMAHGASEAQAVITLDDVRAVWPQIMKSLRTANLPVYALLNSADSVPIDVGVDYLVLGFSPRYKLLKEKMEDQRKRAIVEGVLAQRFGRPYALRCVIMGQGGGGPRTATPPPQVPPAEDHSVPPSPPAQADNGQTAPRTMRESPAEGSTSSSSFLAQMHVPESAVIADDNFLELAARAFRQVHAQQEQQDVPPLDLDAES